MKEPTYRHISNNRLNALDLASNEVLALRREVEKSPFFSTEFKARLQRADALVRWAAGRGVEGCEQDEMVKQLLADQFAAGQNRHPFEPINFTST
jgi:hypothetical protein